MSLLLSELVCRLLHFTNSRQRNARSPLCARRREKKNDDACLICSFVTGLLVRVIDWPSSNRAGRRVSVAGQTLPVRAAVRRPHPLAAAGAEASDRRRFAALEFQLWRRPTDRRRTIHLAADRHQRDANHQRQQQAAIVTIIISSSSSNHTFPTEPESRQIQRIETETISNYRYS